MKTEWIGVIVAGVFVLITVFAVSCTRKGKVEVSSITAREAMGEARNDFAVLIDVREKDELGNGIAENAIWIPTSKIKAGAPEWKSFLDQTSKDKKLIFYCAAGGRAGSVAAMAAEAGFKAANMGGFKDWVAAGLPVKK
jgi:rhodanese-related sulfurtransferase